MSRLAKYIAVHAVETGFPRLANATKTTVWRILDEHDLKPHKIKYYFEKRDPDFDRKIQEVLMVYKDVSLYPAGYTDEIRPKPIYTVSVDEKPGVQAVAVTDPDLPPVPGKESCTARDCEYVRHGTLSAIAALDLHTGEIIANVEPRHRSCEFIDLLERIDSHYPIDATIRIVLDNHSAHISKETMAYLATRPGRLSMYILPNTALG